MLLISRGQVLLDGFGSVGAGAGTMTNAQGKFLHMERCPYCSVHRPQLEMVFAVDTETHFGGNPRHWVGYKCLSCGGVVMTVCLGTNLEQILESYPQARQIADSIPERARELLAQCQGCLGTPAGSIVLAASAVDSMLKAKGMTEGTLYGRISTAVTRHVITVEMGDWAHDVRLDANDLRHADESMPLPTMEDAERALEFAIALAEYLFVLPARVRRGRASAAAR